MKNKKLLIIVVILVIAVVAFTVWKKNKEKSIRLQQSEAEQTNANGLFGYLGTIWESTTGTASKKMTESEAKEVSKRIADYKESGSEADAIQANSLIQELAVQGWSYVGYNQVAAINA